MFSIHPGEVKIKLQEMASPEKTKQGTLYVIEMIGKLAKMHQDFKIDLPVWI